MQKEPMSTEKFLIAAAAGLLSILILALLAADLHATAVIGRSPDPVATACALQNPHRMNPICILHEQNLPPLPAESLHTFAD